MNNTRPLIVISNDDGVSANGIKTLIDVAKNHADIVAVAPDTERSGQAHSVTVTNPLKARLISDTEGVKIYSCNGTPVDSVKLGIKIFSDRTPDLVLSGINHGSNVGNNVFYSGTMGIAIEALFEGVPSIGFSLCNHSADADFSETVPFIDSIIKNVLSADKLYKQFCLNVNFPYKPEGGIKGMKVCSMSEGIWKESYEERIIPTTKKPYYWITGVYEDHEPLPDTEQYAINNGYGSIMPISIDLTHRAVKGEVAELLKAECL